ncbi:MAG TPA: TlpA disulfide reductase family protein [Bryobacteraceae bacterium]|nr:TlpA disulfide reductase family protein [Bryobacteraceae bacterium]
MKFVRAVPLMLAPLILAAQTAGTLNLYPTNPQAEQNDLNQTITEANGSAIDLTRGLEEHLKKYPNAPRRAEIEASLYKTAAENNDTPRIITYGEKLLLGHPQNELEILDRVIRALLASGDQESAKKALVWSARYEAGVRDMRARAPEGHTTKAQWADLADRAMARQLVLKARATGILGNAQEAVTLATQAWTLEPGAESASEIAKWEAKAGRDTDAIEHYADAAMIEDTRAPWNERQSYRQRAGELYAMLHGSQDGLGELFLKAWDRDAKALKDRTARYKAMDPNYGVTDVFGFTLPGAGNNAPDARTLDLSKLKGKTLVMDFWATWCMPCIAQHPMIEHVKEKYAGSPDVVFLSLDADDDHSAVAPFLAAQKWKQPVYLESGLAGLLNTASLPTILVIDGNGQVFSRMTGYSADVFERMLSERIDGARAQAPKQK